MEVTLNDIRTAFKRHKSYGGMAKVIKITGLSRETVRKVLADQYSNTDAAVNVLRAARRVYDDIMADQARIDQEKKAALAGSIS